ncbi:MAG TPA: CBS domain-containing protein [Aldersonia sp.]
MWKNLLPHGLRSLPVVDADGRVVGMFSRGDALRIMLKPDEAVVSGAQNLLDEYTGERRWRVTVRKGAATISGRFVDESERRIALALVRTVPAPAPRPSQRHPPHRAPSPSRQARMPSPEAHHPRAHTLDRVRSTGGLKRDCSNRSSTGGSRRCSALATCQVDGGRPRPASGPGCHR